MQPNEQQENQTQPQTEVVKRAFIKFNHEEVEALLNLLNEMDDLSATEQSARSKLKRIYARQIISHERNELDSSKRQDEKANVNR